MLNLTRVTSARPSAALVISIIALIASLAGTAFAAGVLPAGSVGSEQLRDWSVTSGKLKANSVNSSKVVNRSLRSVDFAKGQLAPLAYAQVSPGATPKFTESARKGFTGVVRSGVGTYCVTPPVGVSSTAHPAFVSVPPNGATEAVALAAVDNSAQPSGCAAGDYKVVTYRIYIEAMGGPLAADDVPFSIVVA